MLAGCSLENTSLKTRLFFIPFSHACVVSERNDMRERGASSVWILYNSGCAIFSYVIGQSRMFIMLRIQWGIHASRCLQNAWQRIALHAPKQLRNCNGMNCRCNTSHLTCARCNLREHASSISPKGIFDLFFQGGSKGIPIGLTIWEGAVRCSAWLGVSAGG